LTDFRSYLHVNGFIHRDIKAANLLIDDDGTVLLGDLGVAADLTEHEHGSATAKGEAIASQRRLVSFDPAARPHDHLARERRQIGKRKSFVGTVSPSFNIHFWPYFVVVVTDLELRGSPPYKSVSEIHCFFVIFVVEPELRRTSQYLSLHFISWLSSAASLCHSIFAAFMKPMIATSRHSALVGTPILERILGYQPF
jgi:serine/threonine protein kinase